MVPVHRESTVVSVYRKTSDTAQTFLPPVQAVADVIPGVGGIIKGVIGGITCVLRLVDVIQLHSILKPEVQKKLEGDALMVDDTISLEVISIWDNF